MRKGDLLFNWRNGSASHLGKTVYFDLDGEFTHVSFLLRLRFNPNGCSKYCYYLLNGFRSRGYFSSSKAGVNNTFNMSELQNLPVLLPPKAEQEAIAAYLDSEIARTLAPLPKIARSVETLEKYRAALISAAVTGKIDVRQGDQT
jgi:type I restriction enzyme S subunit